MILCSPPWWPLAWMQIYATVMATSLGVPIMLRLICQGMSSFIMNSLATLCIFAMALIMQLIQRAKPLERKMSCELYLVYRKELPMMEDAKLVGVEVAIATSPQLLMAARLQQK